MSVDLVSVILVVSALGFIIGWCFYQYVTDLRRWPEVEQTIRVCGVASKPFHAPTPVEDDAVGTVYMSHPYGAMDVKWVGLCPPAGTKLYLKKDD